MGLKPWRHLESWRCVGCGLCCYGFRVGLRAYEYARIVKVRPEAVEVDKYGGVYLRKINDRCLFLEMDRFCGLQPYGMKLLACKMWPFCVYMKPKAGDAEQSHFQYGQDEYYVYIHPEVRICPGVNRGRPGDLEKTISEVIEIIKNPLKSQNYSTCKVG